MPADSQYSYEDLQELTPETLKKISDFLKSECGIHVEENKKTLIESRLLKRLREFSFNSFQDYFDYLVKSEEEKQFFINSMTTNKTEFFRESYQFDYLIERVKKKRPPEGQFWSLWSAASSSGEEAYTLAMILDQVKNHHFGHDFRILGTDIDTEVLKKAGRGIYPPEKVKEQVPEQFSSYFHQHYTGDYLVDANLMRRVKFRSHNLIRESFPFEGFFDFIFLRNILIYFDPPTVEAVINKLKRNLRVGGLLFLGASEALPENYKGLKQVESSVYERIK